MPARHRSRHRAVQILYQCDLRDIGADEAIRNYYDGLYTEESQETPSNDGFMEDLVRGALEHRQELDTRIEQHSPNWRLERMSAVDRNILRLATHELAVNKAPAAVIIDEALELARRFSGEESVAFINGVLDAIRKELSLAR